MYSYFTIRVFLTMRTGYVYFQDIQTIQKKEWLLVTDDLKRGMVYLSRALAGTVFCRAWLGTKIYWS